MSGISGFLYGILAGINNFVGNYGVSIIIFTFLMRMICMPFDYKSRKGMRKMAAIQPKINALQKKYGNDKQKLQQKQAELMRKEGYNPLSGCLPMLLTWPLMIAMFAAMRDIANEQLAWQTVRIIADAANENPDIMKATIQSQDTFLWVRNLWMTDSPFNSYVPTVESLKAVSPQVWDRVFSDLQNANNAAMFENFKATLKSCQAKLAEEGKTIAFLTDEGVAFNVVKENFGALLSSHTGYSGAIATSPSFSNISLIFVKINWFINRNGYLILPILAGVTQVLQTKFMNAQQPQQPANPNGGAGSGNFMKWFFPCLSVFFCLSSNAGFALYWVTSSVVSSLQGIVINKILEKKDAQNSENKQENIIGKGSVK